MSDAELLKTQAEMFAAIKRKAGLQLPTGWALTVEELMNMVESGDRYIARLEAQTLAAINRADEQQKLVAMGRAAYPESLIVLPEQAAALLSVINDDATIPNLTDGIAALQRIATSCN